VQGRKLAHQREDVGVAGEPVEQGPAGGHSVLGSWPLPGRHTTTVGQNHRSPGGLSSGCPPLAGAAKWRRPLATLRRFLMSCATHLNRPIGADLTSAPGAKLAVQNRISAAAGPCWCCVAMAGRNVRPERTRAGHDGETLRRQGRRPHIPDLRIADLPLPSLTRRSGREELLARRRTRGSRSAEDDPLCRSLAAAARRQGTSRQIPEIRSLGRTGRLQFGYGVQVSDGRDALGGIPSMLGQLTPRPLHIRRGTPIGP
jgi:hypothetical protein